MKKTFVFFTLCILFSATLVAQSPNAAGMAEQALRETSASPLPYAQSISAEDLRKHLTIIASDEFEGRETGTPGNEKAANYIADHFKNLGMPPVVNDQSYFQKVKFSWTKWDTGTQIEVDGQRFKHLWDFIAFPERNNSMTAFETDEVVFLGYGIDDPEYSDYKKADVKGKVILIYQGEPYNRKGKSHITGTAEASDWSGNWQRKVATAEKYGVKAVLMIEDEIKQIVSANFQKFIEAQMVLDESQGGKLPSINSCYVNPKISKAIMGKKFKKVIKARKKIKRRGKPRSVVLPCKLKINLLKKERILEGVNVLGFIEGSDPQLKEEVVVVTAHYDHLGRRAENIFNGADDNGSGTSTVLEVAEAFAQAKKEGNGPRRSVLCMLVTGEEKGLLGSKFYAEHPIFPLEKTVANVNVDMVGRVDEKYKDNPNYVYVIGSDRLSTELHEINESANKNYTNLVLDYTYNADDDPNRYYYRSDHYNFAEKGIPAIFYFNGTHSDYHKPSDTIDKINFDKMAIIGQLVFHTAWELANRAERIKVNVEGRN